MSIIVNLELKNESSENEWLKDYLYNILVK